MKQPSVKAKNILKSMYHLIPILQDLEHDSYKRIELVMYSAIDCVAMGLDAEMDQEAATDQGIHHQLERRNYSGF